MAFFLIFAPFMVFALLGHLTSADVALCAGAATGLALVVHDAWRGRSTKIFGVATVLVLGGLGLCVAIVPEFWSTRGIQAAIDIAMLAVALGSLILRYPFTLQYAREQVQPEVAGLPGFFSLNVTLTWVWAGACTLMLIANLATLAAPSLPLWFGFALTFLARQAAVQFTKWYPQRRLAGTMPIDSDAAA